MSLLHYSYAILASKVLGNCQGFISGVLIRMGKVTGGSIGSDKIERCL